MSRFERKHHNSKMREYSFQIVSDTPSNLSDYPIVGIIPTVSTAISSRRVVTANIWSFSSLLLVGCVGFGWEHVRLKNVGR